VRRDGKRGGSGRELNESEQYFLSKETHIAKTANTDLLCILVQKPSPEDQFSSLPFLPRHALLPVSAPLAGITPAASRARRERMERKGQDCFPRE
jgi:hypothetical protein